MPRLSAEIEAKSSLGFEIGFGTRQIEIDCQNDVQNASKTTRFSTLNVPIVLDREALGLRPKGHPDRSASLNNFAIRLCSRYHQLGALQDLDDAIVLDREALGLWGTLIGQSR